jgi:adenosylcobinamide kinase/adenosylcobinamide-phosphate guanylyltransferase
MVNMNKLPASLDRKQKSIFVTGGARSGKSSFALKKAEKIDGRRLYIATAEALDEEMESRIIRHKTQRGDGWDTFEEPLMISEVIRKLAADYKVIVVDCLTMWLSNAMHRNADIERETENLANILRDKPDTHIYIVSNEVGAGIVPENELARRFRDLAGIINQKIAGASDEVFMVVAGIPIKIKG